jgi:hypothetical protein
MTKVCSPDLNKLYYNLTITVPPPTQRAEVRQMRLQSVQMAHVSLRTQERQRGIVQQGGCIGVWSLLMIVT